jgi:RND superfamily putative drug exporter
MQRPSGDTPPRGVLRRGFAWTVVTLRWLLLVGWAVATVACVVLLPSLTASANSGGLSAFLPSPSPAIRTELRSVHAFGLPLLARVVVVQRDPHGLSARVQASTIAAAVRYDAQAPHPIPGLTAAAPVVNAQAVFPFAREDSTTALTYLAFQPGLSVSRQVDLANLYADQYLRTLPGHGSVVGVTGLTAGRYEQQATLRDRLVLVEVVAIVVVLLIVGLQLRSIIAPLVLLTCAVVSYLVTLHVGGWLGERLDVSVPTELEPIIVVLLLGVVTDYSIFFFTGARRRLVEGEERLAAVRHAVATNGPWVLGAGLAVAVGTAVLLVARLDIFRALGPGLALTVVIGLVVSLTLMPAVLAILGRPVFWPGLPRSETPPHEPRWRFRRASMRAITTRPVAALLVCGLTVGLGITGWQLTHIRLGLSIISGLPASSTPHRADHAAAAGFVAGITDPTVVVVRGPAVGRSQAALDRLQQELASQPGVAGVLGPADNPSRLRLGVFVAPDGAAARYLVVLDSSPLQSRAIDQIEALTSRLPGLLRRAGIRGSAGVAGDTAIAAEVTSATRSDTVRVVIAALIIDLAVLLLFLRAPLAALVLLIANAIGLAASLGLTTLVLQQLFDLPEFTFYVPLAVAVLLFAFGSDYNLFFVGRVWDAAAGHTMKEAAVRSGPAAARSVGIAGLTLAASFATLALVPLLPFREFALAMVIGVLLDVFVVRSLMVPALLSLMGSAGSWPRRRGVPRDDAVVLDPLPPH